MPANAELPSLVFRGDMRYGNLHEHGANLSLRSDEPLNSCTFIFVPVLMNAFRHIFFDLDHTLWDFEQNSQETLSELFYELNLGDRGIPSAEVFHVTYRRLNRHYWDLYERGLMKREELRHIRFRSTLKEFQIEDDFLAGTLSETYLNKLPDKTNLIRDAIEVLEYLRKKYSLHIITNGFEVVQKKKIHRTGLNSFFTLIVTSEGAGFQKPNKEIFEYALELAGAKPMESIFIGDSIEADIKGALAAGIEPVYFNPERFPHEENIAREIHELNELKTFL